MYLKYWALKEKPFENTPDPRFVYYSPDHAEAYARLKYVIDQERGAAMLTGEYGAGKTLISRVLVDELVHEEKYDVALVVNPMLSGHDLLREIIFQLKGGEAPENKLDILHMLNDHLYKNYQKKKRTIVIVDEAQAINEKDVFEELRLLLNFQLNNKFLLSLILIGQPELREKIDNIPQLKQRLSLTYHLGGLDNERVAEYVFHRLRIAGQSEYIFEGKAINKISAGAGGIPRKINNICEIALLEGMFEKRKNINHLLVEKIMEDLRI